MSDFCSLATREAGQSIVGTAAAETSAWVLVEYRAPWESKGVERADFGPALRARLDAWLLDVPGSRAQLLRRPGIRGGPPAVYIGVSEPGRERVHAVDVDDYDALAALDVPGAVARMRRGEDPGLGRPIERPLVLVCTHGKRDRCCAKWGQPVYDTLASRADIDLWQTSHLGGHRFAATALCLPEGLCYGWLEPSEADAWIDAHLAGEIHRLDRLRGRTAWSGPGQAAEHFIRQELRLRTVGGVAVDSVQASSEGRFSAMVRVGERSYRVEFRHEVLPEQAPPSCGKELAPVDRYTLTALEAPGVV